MSSTTSNDTRAAKGNIAVFRNTRRQGSDDPSFKGTLTLPGSDNERRVALWELTSKKTGQALLIGSVAPEEETAEGQQVSYDTTHPGAPIRIPQHGGKHLTIDPNDILLFENTRRAGEDPSRPRPDYWGYYNAGKGQPLMKVVLWEGVDRNDNEYLNGKVEVWEPRETPDAALDEEDDFDEEEALE